MKDVGYTVRLWARKRGFIQIKPSQWVKDIGDVRQELLITKERYPKRWSVVASIGVTTPLGHKWLLFIDHEWMFPYSWRGALDDAFAIDSITDMETRRSRALIYLDGFVGIWYDRWTTVDAICSYLRSNLDWPYTEIGCIRMTACDLCNVSGQANIPHRSPSDYEPKEDVQALREWQVRNGDLRFLFDSQWQNRRHGDA